MLSDMKHVLVVAAHPDDEVLGCGGTVARLTRAGVRCDCAILGEGLTARYRDGVKPTVFERDALTANRLAAASILGFNETCQLGFPDNSFDSIPTLHIIQAVEDLILRLRPDTVFTHNGCDLNRDHELVHRAVLTATRPLEGCHVRRLYAFEVPSSTEWAFGQLGAFRPNIFVDITSTIEEKLDAMAAYEGESRPYPHPRSALALESLARARGVAAGSHVAEAFEAIRVLT